MIIVSFYTINTEYEKVAQNLIASLRMLGINYDIQGMKNTGNWRKNLHYKITFIRKMLLKHKQPVLWIDCDAIMRQSPALLVNAKCDIAYCKLKNELLGGTLFFNDTKIAHEILKQWEMADSNTMKNEPHILDQKVLQILLSSNTWWTCQMKVIKLPQSYAKIFDNKYQKDIVPVIEHFQLSRKQKEWVH